LVSKIRFLRVRSAIKIKPVMYLIKKCAKSKMAAKSRIIRRYFGPTYI